MGETEDKILAEEAARLEEDRQKWITERKAQRSHFEQLKLRMMFLKQGVGNPDEIWEKEIQPKIDQEPKQE